VSPELFLRRETWYVQISCIAVAGCLTNHIIHSCGSFSTHSCLSKGCIVWSFPTSDMLPSVQVIRLHSRFFLVHCGLCNKKCTVKRETCACSKSRTSKIYSFITFNLSKHPSSILLFIWEDRIIYFNLEQPS
jgi:hypothetical protein